MDIGIRVEERKLVFALSGELDECSYSKVKEHMDASISRYIYDKVIFDFSHLTFMDSTGIGMLIGRYKILKKYKKPCYISGVTPAVEKILNMTGIFSIIPQI